MTKSNIKHRKTKIKIRTYDYESDLLRDKEPVKNDQHFNTNLNFEKMQTIWDVFSMSAERFKDKRCTGMRRRDDGGVPSEYVWQTYGEVAEKVDHLAKGMDLLIAGLGPRPPFEDSGGEQEGDLATEEHSDEEGDLDDEVLQEGDWTDEDCSVPLDVNTLSNEPHENVGIYAVNRPEWLQMAIALLSTSQKPVPLYDTFGPEAIEFIVGQTGIRIVVCSADKVGKLIESKEKGRIASLQIIIQIDFDPLFNNTSDKMSPDAVSRAEDAGLRLIAFSQIAKMGKDRSAPFAPDRPTKDSLAYIMYTSGTSGRPKGVMLLHRSAVFVLRKGLQRVHMEADHAYLSYLPLAHIFETLVSLVALTTGVHIGYFSGHIRHIASDLLALRPHYFAAVPRVFSKVYAKVLSAVEAASAPRRWLFALALRRGAQQTHSPEGLAAAKPLDRFVWARLRARLGFDRLRVVLLGGAPCPAHLLEFLRVLLRAAVLQGYGLTETFAVVSLTHGADHHLGHAGLPVGCRVRLGAGGEVQVRGPNVFAGYFRDAARTRAAFAGRWFRTGDVGRFNPNGTLSVVDRIKALFKLSQGEYVSPEQVEAAYGRAPAVQQVFVFGESTQSFPLAVVVPDAAWVLQRVQRDGDCEKAKESLAARDFGAFSEQFAAVVTRHLAEIKEAVLENLRGYEQSLRRFEVVRDILLEVRLDEALCGFSVENECLSPSFKLRRHELVKRYKEDLEALYERLNDCDE